MTAALTPRGGWRQEFPCGPPRCRRLHRGERMTHDYLVRRAVKFLEKRHGSLEHYRQACSPVLGERSTTWVSETPDAIGWNHQGSFLIECKVSQQDFYADRGKWFRKRPAEGIGRCRYYMVPYSLCSWCESRLPEGWGLLGVTDKQVRVMKEAVPVEYSMRREILFLRALFYKVNITEPPTDDILAARRELQEDLFVEAREI